MLADWGRRLAGYVGNIIHHLQTFLNGKLHTGQRIVEELGATVSFARLSGFTMLACES
jgi:hypothetical protein